MGEEIRGLCLSPNYCTAQLLLQSPASPLDRYEVADSCLTISQEAEAKYKQSKAELDELVSSMEGL